MTQTIIFFSANGGVGTTSLAVRTAWLAADSGDPITFLDANRDSDAKKYLGLVEGPPAQTPGGLFHWWFIPVSSRGNAKTGVHAVYFAEAEGLYQEVTSRIPDPHPGLTVIDAGNLNFTGRDTLVETAKLINEGAYGVGVFSRGWGIEALRALIERLVSAGADRSRIQALYHHGDWKHRPAGIPSDIAWTPEEHKFDKWIRRPDRRRKRRVFRVDDTIREIIEDARNSS